ncbi:MAG: hypothetical protein RLY78_1589 [Pseudomonadota bacterium]|jgi:hypothetical protein
MSDSIRAAAPSVRSAAPGPDHEEAGRPWWRYGIVWLVVGGPLAVVVAGLTTAVIAYRHADEVLVDRATVQSAVRPSGETPAMMARNHAATAAAADAVGRGR